MSTPRKPSPRSTPRSLARQPSRTSTLAALQTMPRRAPSPSRTPTASSAQPTPRAPPRPVVQLFHSKVSLWHETGRPEGRTGSSSYSVDKLEELWRKLEMRLAFWTGVLGSLMRISLPKLQMSLIVESLTINIRPMRNLLHSPLLCSALAVCIRRGAGSKVECL